MRAKSSQHSDIPDKPPKHGINQITLCSLLFFQRLMFAVSLRF